LYTCIFDVLFFSSRIYNLLISLLVGMYIVGGLLALMLLNKQTNK